MIRSVSVRALIQVMLRP